MAKRSKETTPDSNIVKVVDPLYDAPVEVEVTHEPQPAPQGPTVGRRIARVFEFILRLVSWVIILGVIGGALYIGLPLLYQRFVVPVEQNTAQVGELQSKQKQLEQEIASLQEQLKTLETGQSQNVQSLTELDQRMGDLETDVAAHTKSLAALDEMQSKLEAQDEATSAELQRQIDLMKAMELLSRARLYMYQSNFGLAKVDVQAGRDLLAQIKPDVNKSLADDLDAVIRRLDLVLSNLPNFPVAASDDLDIAWQILVSGLPEVSTTGTETPAPASTPSATLTMTPTSTLQTTLVPSATP